MSFLDRFRNMRSQPVGVTSTKPETSFRTESPVVFVIALDSNKSRPEQMETIISAASHTVGLKSNDFPYASPVKTAGSGLAKYVTGSQIYNFRDGTVMATVSLDDSRGLVYVTLEGNTRKDFGSLSEELDGNRLSSHEIFYE